MSHGPFRVIDRVVAKPESVDQVRSILSAIVEPTRRETGCVSYHVAESGSHMSEFVCIEEWATAEAEQAHFLTPHILSALQQLSGLLAAEPDIRRYWTLK